MVMLALLYAARSAPASTPERNLSLPLKGLIAIHIVWCLVAISNSIVPVMSVKKVLSVLAEYYVLYSSTGKR